MSYSKKCFNRWFVHPEIELNFLDSSASNFKKSYINDFIASVQHWKNILAEKYQIGLGSKVGFGFSYLDLRYISLIFAVSELGGIVLILDKVSINSKVHPRCQAMAPWDLFIHCSDSPDILNLGRYAKVSNNADDWFDYQSSANHRFSDIIAQDEQAIFMQAPTSGSTGAPKVIDYSNYWLQMLGEHCAKTFDYKPTDRILHLSNLHHGGSSGTFFFPTLKYCKQHFFINALEGIDNTNLRQRVIDCIIQQQITRVMFPNSLLLDKILQEMPPLHHKCHFYTLQANHRSWINQARRVNLAGLHSIFGSTEMLGPIFLNTIDHNTHDDHDVLNYGKPLESFYQVQITDDGLHVRDITGRSAFLNDRFAKDDLGNYFFNDRSDLIRINEVFFTLYQLQHIINESGLDQTLCFLVCDSTTNKVYLLVDHTLQDLPTTQEAIARINASFAKINTNCGINYVDYQPIVNFISGIKISRESILAHFREKYQLT